MKFLYDFYDEYNVHFVLPPHISQTYQDFQYIEIG